MNAALPASLGGLFGCSERQVVIQGQTWRWRIEFTKFRGWGPDATEASVGVDGMLEIVLLGNEGGRTAVLFQAKIGSPTGTRALERAAALSTWREATVFLGYGPDRISVYPLDSVFDGAIENQPLYFYSRASAENADSS
jgi:hypothetical protein